MKYIKKVIIKNFQSHKNTEIEFDPGLNIIVGQSDKGKSAILRALKWVLFNEPRGTDFIRHGTDECIVTIITGDNYTISRIRKKNKNIYIVIKPNGEKLEFENFGNNVPFEVIEATGVKKIKLDTDTETKLNFNEQLDPPFLLSETGTIRAKAIGRIVNTNIIDAAERDILKDISNNNLSIKNLEKQLESIDEELTQYSDIEEQEKNIRKIDTLFNELSTLNKKVEKLKEYKSKIQSIDKEINNNTEIINKLKHIPIISSYCSDLVSKNLYYNQLCNYKNKINSINLDIMKNSNIVKKLTHLNHVENSIKYIDSKLQTCKKLCELKDKYKDIESKLRKGNEYILNVKQELRQSISQYSQKLKHLGKCPTCYSLISDSTVNQIISELEGEVNVNN